MGKFHLVYYISMGTPSIEASLQMAETYLAHGVSALQFDLPSRNPYRETLFIRKRMAKAWETYGGYEPFLTALTEFRRKHPDFEMQMVSYEDVILTIGTARYMPIIDSMTFCMRLRANITCLKMAFRIRQRKPAARPL